MEAVGTRQSDWTPRRRVKHVVVHNGLVGIAIGPSSVSDTRTKSGR
jgi:hypothetical protein